jgi:MFS transporter, Spinster family, sphingosine-1-phosphate transporter
LSLSTRALIVLTSLNLLDYLDRNLIAALGPLVKAELGLSHRAFGFLTTAFFLVYLCTSPVFGYLGDRWGRIRLMTGGAILWSLATSLTFWVRSYPALLLARGAVGVGEASFGTLAPAFLADLLPLKRRTRALGLFYLALPVGTALGFLAGGLIGAKWGWRPAFLLAGIPGLAMAGLVYCLPQVRSPNLEEPASHGHPWGAALRESWALWRIPTLHWVTLGYAMITFTLGGLNIWMPIFLHESKGLSLLDANLLLCGAVALAGGLGTMTGGLLGGRLQAYTVRAPLWISAGSVILAIPMAAVVILVNRPGLFIPALASAVFLLFANFGILTAVVVSVAGPRRRAQAVALNIVIIHLLGDVPSPLLIGWIADASSLKWGVSLTLLALAIGAALIFLALPHLPKDLAAAGELESPEAARSAARKV